MKEQIEEFVTELRHCIAEGTFVKLSLGNYKGVEEHLQRIFIRRVDTKSGEKLAFQFRYATRDVVKNFDLERGVSNVGEQLENGFRSGHLFTTENDIQIIIGKRSARFARRKPTSTETPSISHNREKKYLIDPSAYYLKALGVTTELLKPARKQGRSTQDQHAIIRADQRDKWRQINKFVEIVDGLIRNSTLKDKNELRIVDMGSGKGYLTFALYDHLQKPDRHSQKPDRKGGLNDQDESYILSSAQSSVSDVRITGVEQRKELVTLCNQIAQTAGFDGLKFVQGSIAEYDPDDVDILIALHACDTATDDALYKGISANASIIVAAPCCHHELKKQLKPPELLSGILKHPVMLERTAEMITDGIRSLLLESQGYKTKMFEFVSTEHTPKNNMLVATRVSSPHVNSGSTKLSEVGRVMSEFGIAHQRLADLIARGEQTDEV